MQANMEMTGDGAVATFLDQFSPAMMRAARRVLYEEAEKVMAEAKRLVPVDLGTLRDTGKVLPPVESADGVEVVMGFGDSAVDYAEVQHENLSYHHTVGQAKYLEQPFMAAVPGVTERLARETKDEAGG